MREIKRPSIKIIIILSVIAILCVSLIIFALWFFSPGVQIFDRLAHIEVKKTGYIIDKDSMEVVGQTEVAIDGTAFAFNNPIQSGKATSDFKGSFFVADFQNTEEGTITPWSNADHRDHNGFYTLNYMEDYFYYYGTGSTIGYCKYSFMMYLHPDDPDFLLIMVLSDEKERYIVCADTEEAAVQDFQWAMGIWNAPK